MKDLTEHKKFTNSWSKKFNTKGLGLKQLQLLHRMAKEKLVIRVIFDWYDNSKVMELQDESGDNSYESVSVEMMKSLSNRRLFDYLGWKPSLRITIDTYSLKKRTIEALGLSNGQKAQVSDTTKMPS